MRSYITCEWPARRASLLLPGSSPADAAPVSTCQTRTGDHASMSALLGFRWRTLWS